MTNTMTPAQRRQRAQIAALERASKPEYDGKTATASAREAAWEKWCRQVDPEGVLTLEERHKRAQRARQAAMKRGQLARSRSRKGGK